MKNFPVLFSRSARKDLESLDARLVEKIFPKIEALSHNPRPVGCKKLKGSLKLTFRESRMPISDLII